MSKKMTQEEFIARAREVREEKDCQDISKKARQVSCQERFNSIKREYSHWSFIEGPKSSHDRITGHCEKHNCDFILCVKEFPKATGCPECMGRKKKISCQEQFSNIKKEYSHWIFKEKPKKIKDRIIGHCEKHNQDFSLCIDCFPQVGGCLDCMEREKRTPTKLSFNKIKEDYPHWTFNEEPKNNKDRITGHCEKHNCGFPLVTNSFPKQGGCPECMGREKRTPTKLSFNKIKEDYPHWTFNEEPKNSHDRITGHCEKHNCDFILCVNKFPKSTGCPECVGRIKQVSCQERFNDIRNEYPRWTFNEEPENSIDRVTGHCETHNCDFILCVDDFPKSTGCQECMGRIKRVSCQERFNDIRNEYPHWTFIEEPKTVMDRITGYCEKHNHDFPLCINAFPKSTGCPECTGRKTFIPVKKSFDEIRNEYPHWTFNEEPKNSHDRITGHCEKHNCGFPLVTNSFPKQGGCPECMGRIKQVSCQEQFNDIRNEYPHWTFNEEPKNSKDRIIGHCKKHNHNFPLCVGEFPKETGCPYCMDRATIRKFTKSSVLSLLTEHDLEYLTVQQLIEYIKMGKCPASFGALKFSNPGSKERKDTIKSLKEKLEGDESEEDFEREEKETIEKAESEFESGQEKSSDGSIAGVIDDDMTAETVIRSLKIPDNPKFSVSEGEGEKFIVTESIHLLWNKTLEDEDGFIAKYKAEPSSGAFFDRIRDMFIREYSEVKSMEADGDCIFPYEPNLMQKLIVHYVRGNPHFGNWCGTGSGKSFSRDWASRAIDARVSVYVVPNAVIDTTVKAIGQAYNDVNIVIPQEQSNITVLDRDKHNIIILNYEKFQQPYTGAWIAELLRNRIDFICLDEIQNVKVRNTDNISLRNRNMNTFIKNAREANPELKVLAMSATPIINNLTEVRELMGLLTGTIHDEIGDRASLDNIHNAYKVLIINGFRYVPKYDIKIDERMPEIDGLDIKDEILDCKDGDILRMEKTLVAKKVDWCVANRIFRKGTIVYTHYVNKGIVSCIRQELEKAGFKTNCYTGNEDAVERAGIVRAFQNGKIDILVGSRPIVEGIDGLQHVCDRIVAVSLPWTASDWNQLIGRIYRQGSKFKDIAVVVPQIVIDQWSYDKRRMDIILYKKTLGEAVVDGSFEHFSGYNGKAMQNKLLKQALEALRNGIQDKEIVRQEVETDTIDTSIQKRDYADSLMNSTHRKANTCRHENIGRNVFEDSREKFREYHRIRREAIQNKWIFDPLDKVAEIINSYKPKRYENIIDLGCGENLLKKKVIDGEKRITGVDVEQIDETVVKADFANLNGIIEDESMQMAVHCLSLWGTLDSCIDYFKEDYRILESGMDAPLIIVEPADKFGDSSHFGTIDDFVSRVESVGFRKNGNAETENGFCFFRFTK